MSPRNKYSKGLQRIRKPVTGSLLLSLALGQPVMLLAQVPAPQPPAATNEAAPAAPVTGSPVSVVAPAAASAVVPAAPAAAPAATPAAPVSPILPTTPAPFRPRPPALPSALAVAPAAASTPVAAASTNALPTPPSLISDLPPAVAEKLVLLNFKDAPVDLVLEQISEWTGRMLIKGPGVQASITIKSNEKLPTVLALQAIETVLSMNNVGLVKMGEKFLKVVQIANILPEGAKINFQHPEKPYPEADQLVSQIVQLKYMDPTEALPVIQNLIHGYGKIQAFERTNSLLITDTGNNLNRILDVLAYIDQPVESKIETRIYEIRYAKASDVASRINELIAETQGKEEKPRIDPAAAAAPATPAIPTPPGVIRAPRPAGSTGPSVSTSGETAAEAAERGVIRGKVKIVSDERMNILFIISRAENFTFFDKIITVLDRQTDPEITVRVLPLQFAKSDEISSILNEFIGAAKEETTKSGTATGQPSPSGTASTDARSLAIRDFIASRTAAAQQPSASRPRLAPISDADKDVIGRLSPTTRILAYKPTNSILLMGRRSDLDALGQLVDQLDIMLAQVLIEAVIIEVNLGSDLSYGVDWLQRSMTMYKTTTPGANGGVNVQQPVMAFGGGSAFGGGGFADASQVNRNTALGSGLTYYTTLFDLNIDAVIKMAQSSRDARILQTPVVLTTDNKEATIKVGESRPIVNANIVQTTGQNTQNYEYKDIGIELKVTPRINPKGVVGMEVKQTADNVGGFDVVNGANVPIITRREMSADISVKHNQTVILGGLTSTDKTKSRSGVPILSDIPLLGSFFRSDSFTDTRTELLVLLTPYVLKSPEEAREETARLHVGSASSKTRWHDKWSDSELPQMEEKDLAELIARRKTRLLKADEEEKGGVRVSSSTIEDIKPAIPQLGPKPASTNAPALIAPVPEAPAATANPPAANPAATAPQAAPVVAQPDPNAPVPRGK